MYNLKPSTKNAKATKIKASSLVNLHCYKIVCTFILSLPGDNQVGCWGALLWKRDGFPTPGRSAGLSGMGANPREIFSRWTLAELGSSPPKWFHPRRRTSRRLRITVSPPLWILLWSNVVPIRFSSLHLRVSAHLNSAAVGFPTRLSHRFPAPAKTNNQFSQV